ncbi:MAG: Uma2 family endonuclease, partial [Lachnospiraceae bacterium]|nr:Uma2 family endonuclease [Lachnospiraceae bacterium]
GAPDWIIEIVSPGTASHDYIRKLNLYADAGVVEYWIVDPRSEKIFVYYLTQSEIGADSYTFQDKVKVSIYDDLWIDFKELIS